MSDNAEFPADRPALLLTRPREQAEDFLESLTFPDGWAGKVCLSPLLEIRSLGLSIDANSAEGAIFSSRNGVLHGPAGQGRPAYCVGDTTAEAARQNGWQVRAVAQDADALVAALTARLPQMPLVHFSGQHRRGDIAERLAGRGAEVTVVPVYDQALLPLTREAQDLLTSGAAIVLPLFSPRTAQQFVTVAQETRHVRAVAMSEAVAVPLRDRPFAALHVLEAPTGSMMKQAVEMLLSGDSLP